MPLCIWQLDSRYPSVSDDGDRILRRLNLSFLLAEDLKKTDCPYDGCNWGYSNTGGCNNVGCFNHGTGNIGNFNEGTANVGESNTGTLNIGYYNDGTSKPPSLMH